MNECTSRVTDRIIERISYNVIEPIVFGAGFRYADGYLAGVSAGSEDPGYEPEPYESEPRISADARMVMVDGHVLTPEGSRVDRAAGNRANSAKRENNVATDSVDGYNVKLGSDWRNDLGVPEQANTAIPANHELETQKSFSFLRYANDAMGVSSSEAYSGALAAGDVSSLLSVTGSIAANLSVTSLGLNVLRSAAVASSELAPAGLLLAGAYGSYAYLHDNVNDLVALSKIGSEVTANDVDLSHYDLEARGKLISAGFDPDDITQDYVNSVAKGLWARDNQLNENENPSVLEKRRNDYSKSRPDSGFKDSAGTGMPGPDDFEPDDEEQRSFDPSKEGRHDKVSRHERFGKFYRDAQDKKIWYSKDRAGHGGEHWKKFQEIDGKLEHIADVDLRGNVMSKHKGPTGTKIDINKLIGMK